MDNQHGNRTENTSLVTVLQAVKRNIFRTLNTLDVYIVRDILDNTYKCELITNADIKISVIALQDIKIQKGDVVLVAFTSQDFRASLAQYKNDPISVRNSVDTKSFHELTYGIIIGKIGGK